MSYWHKYKYAKWGVLGAYYMVLQNAIVLRVLRVLFVSFVSLTFITCITCITWFTEDLRNTEPPFFCLKCKMRNPTICSDAEVLTNSWNCLRTKTNLRHTLVGKQLIKEAGAEGRRELIWNAIFNQCCPYFKKITFVSFVRRDITNTEKVLDLWLIIGLYSLIVQA